MFNKKNTRIRFFVEIWKFYFKMVKYNKIRNLMDGVRANQTKQKKELVDWNISKRKKFQTEIKGEEWKMQKKTGYETKIIPWEVITYL